MAQTTLTGFGTQLRELRFKDNWDWFFNVVDCKTLWEAQPTYLIVQCVFLLGGIFSMIHSLRKGGRWPYLWLATIGHGLFVEAMAYFVPEIDNFWHSSTPIMFLGYRLPLHIIFLYPVFIYNAAHAVSRLNLPSWAEPFAVGLTVVLIDIPYDIVSVKFLHWTWHDTDPNIYDRHYWVPWTSYYFHAAFAASFTFWFHSSYYLLKKTTTKWQSRGFFTEMRTVLVTSVLGMVGGVFLFIPLYHPLHDMLKIHTEVIFFSLMTAFLCIILAGLLTKREKVAERVRWVDWLLLLTLIAHYGIYLYFTIMRYPEKEVSMGLHEPVGPCNQVKVIKTIMGMSLKKRKYLCMEDYNEGYFTFSCLPNSKMPKNGAIWYTICGTPFENRYEYVTVLSTICLLAFTVFYNLYFRTVIDFPIKKTGGGKQEDSKHGKSKHKTN